MEDAELIEQLQQKVWEAEELLRRRKEALAALKGKTTKKSPGHGSRGFRSTSIPAFAHSALKGKPAMSLEELTAAVKKHKPDVDSRSVSIALSKYVRSGQHFAMDGEGKYVAK